MKYITIWIGKDKFVFETNKISHIVIHNDNVFVGRYGAPGESIDVALGTADDAGVEHVTMTFNTHGK